MAKKENISSAVSASVERIRFVESLIERLAPLSQPETVEFQGAITAVALLEAILKAERTIQGNLSGVSLLDVILTRKRSFSGSLSAEAEINLILRIAKSFQGSLIAIGEINADLKIGKSFSGSLEGVLLLNLATTRIRKIQGSILTVSEFSIQLSTVGINITSPSESATISGSNVLIEWDTGIGAETETGIEIKLIEKQT